MSLPPPTLDYLPPPAPPPRAWPLALLIGCGRLWLGMFGCQIVLMLGIWVVRKSSFLEYLYAVERNGVVSAVFCLITAVTLIFRQRRNLWHLEEVAAFRKVTTGIAVACGLFLTSLGLHLLVNMMPEVFLGVVLIVFYIGAAITMSRFIFKNSRRYRV